MKIKTVICRVNPWAQRHCERINCPVCNDCSKDQLGRCKRENIKYEMSCKKCNEKYIGETSRSAFERRLEHIEGQRNQKKDNPLFKHDQTVTEGVKQEYKMKVVSVYKDAMSRQVAEKVKISKENKLSKLLNSKNEWGGDPLIRINIGKKHP